LEATLNYASLADQVEGVLRRHVLDCWFPRCIDPSGGFQQNFSRDWKATPDPKRTLVFQARMLWVVATTARLRPELKDQFSAYADHGFQNLTQNFLDSRNGGLFIDTEDREHKHSYSMAFGIFATAAYCRLTGENYPLEIVKDLFAWWVRSAWDERHRGFHDLVNSDGTPISSANVIAPVIRLPANQQTSNTHIHVLEALTELYKVWPDSTVKDCLTECLFALEDVVVRHNNRMFASYSRSWQPVGKAESYGHNIEAYALAVEARRTLNMDADTPLKALATSVIRQGVDGRYDGLYNQRLPRRMFRDKSKLGWAQAEALHGFLVLHRRASDESSAYLKAFLSVWRFINGFVIDPVHNGLFARFDRRGNVQDFRKGHEWKACYHYARGLLSVKKILEELA